TIDAGGAQKLCQLPHEVRPIVINDFETARTNQRSPPPGDRWRQILEASPPLFGYRGPDPKLAGCGLRPGRAEMLRHILALPEKRRVRAACPDGFELRQQGGPGQGKGVFPFLRPKFVQQADAVALAATKNGFHLLSAEPFQPMGLTD